MKKYIGHFSLLLLLSVDCSAVCCCDDPQEVLDSEKNSISTLTKYFSNLSSQTSSRITEYQKTRKYNTAVLLFDSKALVSATKLKESISMKENFEGLQASTAMEAAHIVDALVASELRRDAAIEAENYSAQLNQ
ncbi:MAG: hypothetical protein PHT07_09985 [Paludibacter sp.]|nr:hypothetical protein [Paludibacter sp.]